jgi:uncharacterized LabA/DUF88 family protein
MDRCAIFVDAGYLLAAGGMLCCGTKVRTGFTCDYAGLTAALAAEALSQSLGLTLFRTYWYDGARNAVPTADHIRISEIPNVKLRLGRIAGGAQKGVDPLIVRDLMTLAREHAIATAFVLAGDEDLREGVVAAKDMGLRVVVLGIPRSEGNQARTLIQEADHHAVLAKEFWARYFFKVETPTSTKATPDAAKKIGASFGTLWASGATSYERLSLLSQRPKIPKEVDIQLIQAVEKEVGGLWNHSDLKIVARESFWNALLKSDADTKSG